MESEPSRTAFAPFLEEGLMRFVPISLAMAALWATTACATIVHGSRQSVTVTSDPSGATVTVLSGQTVKSTPGVTPITLNLTRRDPNITVRLQKPGCAPVDVRLKRSTSGWVFTNLIAANPMQMQGYSTSEPTGQYLMTVAVAVPLMFGADFATGAAYKLPKAVGVSLCK